jgi:hypothetical protein
MKLWPLFLLVSYSIFVVYQHTSHILLNNYQRVYRNSTFGSPLPIFSPNEQCAA